jgi:hypothetical protein
MNHRRLSAILATLASAASLLACGASSRSGSKSDERQSLTLSPEGTWIDASGKPVRAAPDTTTLEDGTVVYGAGPLTLLVVFDTSGSMDGPWGRASKWEVANDALLSAISEFEANLTVAAVKFPVDGACGVQPVDESPQLDFRSGAQFVKDWKASAGSPLGDTPLELALAHADDAIMLAVERGLLEQRFRVLVFSDGEPTCQDNSQVMIDYPKRWLEMGIHTYVIGLPGSTPAFNLLGAMAGAGGTGVEQGGGPAIANDPDNQAQGVYSQGVAENDTENIVVDDEEDLEHVARATVR